MNPCFWNAYVDGFSLPPSQTKQLKRYVEEKMSEEQAGFRKGRRTMEQIFVIRQLSEKYTEMNRTLYNNFIDVKQALDSV